MPDQYVFCCLAVLEYAMWKGLLENVNLTKFEESDQSDTDGDWFDIDLFHPSFKMNDSNSNEKINH